MIIYGIKNCDQVRKTIKLAKQQGKNPQLHDYRTDSISEDLLQAMLKDLKFEQLLNKRSTTWRQLNDEQKAQANIELLQQQPTLIKRPIVFEKGHYKIGLSEE